MNTNRSALYIRSIFILMAGALVFAWAANVHADTKETQTQMTIAPDGQIMIRGGVITALGGDTATIATSWGHASFSWVVDLTGSTRYVPSMSSTDAKKALKVGDTISLTGEIDTRTGNPTIIASVFKDTALYQDGATLGGQVVSIDSKHDSFVLTNDAGTTTVTLWGGSIVTKGGNSTSIDGITIGDTVKATGSLNLVTHTMSADRVELSSAQTASASTNIFASIINWLTGNRGAALSVRDR